MPLATLGGVKQRLKPGVARHWLFALAGLVWTGVGVMLLRLAYMWLADLGGLPALELGALGGAIAVAAGLTMFARIARKNIARISEAPDIACVFSFQAWEGYLVMTFMIALGVLLRHSAVPKPALAVVYAGVGGALTISSLRYYQALLARQS